MNTGESVYLLISPRALYSCLDATIQKEEGLLSFKALRFLKILTLSQIQHILRLQNGLNFHDLKSPPIWRVKWLWQPSTENKKCSGGTKISRKPKAFFLGQSGIQSESVNYQEKGNFEKIYLQKVWHVWPYVFASTLRTVETRKIGRNKIKDKLTHKWMGFIFLCGGLQAT